MWDISRCRLSRAEVYVHVRCLWVFNSTKGPKWHWEERKKSSRNYLPHQLQQNLDKDFHAHFAKQGKTPELLMWPKRFHETYFDEKICWCEGQHFPVLLCHLIPISLRFVFDTVDTPHPPPLFMLQGMEIWINGTREIYCKWVRPSQQKNRERERESMQEYARRSSLIQATYIPKVQTHRVVLCFVSLMLGSTVG